MSGSDNRREAIRPLLDAFAAAIERGDWSGALALAQAAATLDPGDPEVLAALERAEAGPGTGARRRLTVMFCDLAGSTELASLLDPEDTRDLLDAYYEACITIVRRHEGQVARLVGDGVLIYFGYPRAHEDDALRAVLSGLAISEAVAGLGDDETRLRVRVGIHTGLAVIADIGRGTWARPGELVGETPNLAARIQAEVPPDAVVISEDTLELVHDAVQTRPLGAPALKGISRPVQLYQVTGMRTDEPPAGKGADGEVAVDRDAEREALAHAWADESGGYVALTGEAGIGKSHLVRHVRDLVPDQGRSVVMRCSALHSNTPLQPVAQLMERHAAGLGPGTEPLDGLGRVIEAAGLDGEENLYLLALMSSLPWPATRAIPDLQPEQARERTLTLVCSWLDALAAEGPLLVVVEDLHWADPSTLALLTRYVTEPRSHRTMTLVTTREGAESLPGQPTEVIALRPLTPADCDELIDRLSEGRMNEATRALVSQRGDGVPLYVRELVTMLAVQGDVHDEAAPAVPRTLHDLLAARLDSFPDERGVVEALAVLGRPASPALIAKMTGQPGDRIRHQLALLEGVGLLRSTGPLGQYEFHHTLLRDAAYDLQLRGHRRILHGRAADAIQATSAGAIEDPQELAYHYARAGELERAVGLWMRAAQRLASLAAHVEAIQSFDLVLEHLAELPGDHHDWELQARSGRAASLLASRGYTAPEVAEAYGRVRELAAAQSAELELSGLYGLWAYYHVTGDAPASLETAQALLARAAVSADSQAALGARAVLGYQLQRVGRLTEAVALLSQARHWNSAQPLYPHHAGIGAAANLALTQWLIGNAAGAREAISSAVTAAEALTGPTAHFTRAYTHAFAAELHQVAGEPEAAAGHAGRAVQISDEFGFSSWLAAGMTNLKIAEVLGGDLEAIPVIEYCLQAWRDAGAASNLTQFGLGLAEAYLAAGRPGDALATLEQALRDAHAAQELYLEPELHRMRARALAQLRPGEETALLAVEQALAAARRSGARTLELRALVDRHALETEAGASPPATRRQIARLLDELGELDLSADAAPERTIADARAVMEGGACP